MVELDKWSKGIRSVDINGGYMKWVCGWVRSLIGPFGRYSSGMPSGMVIGQGRNILGYCLRHAGPMVCL